MAAINKISLKLIEFPDAANYLRRLFENHYGLAGLPSKQFNREVGKRIEEGFKHVQAMGVDEKEWKLAKEGLAAIGKSPRTCGPVIHNWDEVDSYCDTNGVTRAKLAIYCVWITHKKGSGKRD